MKLETEEGKVWTVPHESDPAKIIVASNHRSTLLSMLSSIELAGVAQGYDYDDLAIYRTDSDDGYSHHYEMVLDRGTLVLWFDFEILNYQQHVKETP